MMPRIRIPVVRQSIWFMAAFATVSGPVASGAAQVETGVPAYRRFRSSSAPWRSIRSVTSHPRQASVMLIPY